MIIIKKNQAKKLFSILGLFLALFLFITPVFATYDCVYTTSTGDIICPDIPFINFQTLLGWVVVLLAFICVFFIIHLILNLR